MLLSDGGLRMAIANEEIIIKPPIPSGDNRMQPASIDLNLHHEIQMPIDSINNEALTVEIAKLKDINAFINETTKRIDITEQQGIDLAPGDFILGKTEQWIQLSNGLSGRVEGRSSLARLGIGVHLTAPKIDPGFQNHITLEIFNLGKRRIKLSSGMPICTLLIERLGQPAGTIYQGKFQGTP